MRKFANILFTVTFVAALWTPLIVKLFKLETLPPPNEKRPLAQMPVMPRNMDDLGSFPARCDAYYNDQFGLRTTLIRAHAYTMLEGFGVSPVNYSLAGKDGWLFLNTPEAIAVYRGVPPFTPGELEDRARVRTDRYAWCAQRRIQYLDVLAPEAHRIYPEYLPDWCTRATETTRFDVYADYMAKHSPAPFLDLRKPVLAAKETGIVYRKLDSHWNSEGAFAASLALRERLEKLFPALTEVPPQEVNFGTHLDTAGDHAVMMNLEWLLRDETPEVKLRKFHATRVAREYKGVQLPRNAHIEIFERKDQPRLPRAVIFHDSYLYAMAPFVVEYFSRVTCVHNTAWNEAIITREHPDIVIELHVERTLANNMANAD